MTELIAEYLGEGWWYWPLGIFIVGTIVYGFITANRDGQESWSTLMESFATSDYSIANFQESDRTAAGLVDIGDASVGAIVSSTNAGILIKENGDDVILVPWSKLESLEPIKAKKIKIRVRRELGLPLEIVVPWSSTMSLAGWQAELASRE